MSPQQLLITLFILTPLVSTHQNTQLSAQDIAPRVYCGRALAKMISDLCYNEPGEDKRSGVGAMYGPLIPPYYKEQDNHVGWPWMSPKTTALGSMRGKRFMGGIADECCDKPCSINELLNYCY